MEKRDEYSFVLGDIIEKNYEKQESIESNINNNNNVLESELLERFPNLIPIDIDDESNNHNHGDDDTNKSQSLFARSIASSQQVNANANKNTKYILKNIEKNIYPKTSTVLNDAEHDSIHKENLNLLKNMSEEEILQARELFSQSSI